MAVNPNTDFSAGAVLTASQQNRFPRGVMGYQGTSASFTITTTLADITNMSLTFTAVANRLYKVSYSWPSLIANANNNRATILITNSAGTTTYDQGYWYFVNLNADTVPTRFALLTFSAGSTTLKLRAQIDTGTSTGVLYSDAIRQGQFMIEDVGPA